MTNFELLMKCETPEQFMSRYEFFHGGCRQYGPKANEVWNSLCRVKYPGEYGCHQCRLEFWKSEYDCEGVVNG